MPIVVGSETRGGGDGGVVETLQLRQGWSGRHAGEVDNLLPDGEDHRIVHERDQVRGRALTHRKAKGPDLLLDALRCYIATETMHRHWGRDMIATVGSRIVTRLVNRFALSCFVHVYTFFILDIYGIRETLTYEVRFAPAFTVFSPLIAPSFPP